MGILKKLVVGFLAFLLFVNLQLILFSVAFDQTLLNPSFYPAEVRKYNLHEKIGEVLMSNVPEEAEFVSVIFIESISQEWLEEKSGNLAKNIISYLKSETDTLELSLSISELKPAMREKMVEAVKEMLVEEGMVGADAEEVAPGMVDHALLQIPDSIDLTEMIKPEHLETPREIVGYYLLISRLIYITVFVLLLLLFLVVGKPLLFTKKVGKVFASVGIVTLVAHYANLKILPGYFTLPPQIPKDIVFGFVSDIFAPMQTYALVFLVCGVALFTTSKIILRKARKSAPTQIESKLSNLPTEKTQ